MKREPDPGVAFEPVVTQRAFEQVCNQIRKLLATGSLKTGDKLPAERALAESLEVSRGVVREALRTLEIAGLIELRKGVTGGAFVASGQSKLLSQAFQDMLYLGNISLSELTEARLKFLNIAIELACDRATESDFEALEDNIARTEAAYQRERTDFGLGGERARLAQEFYHLLSRATGNEVIVMTVDAITKMLLKLVNSASRTPLQLIQSRRRFLKHLRARDAAKASKEMSTFLLAVHQYILSSDTQSDVVVEDLPLAASAEKAPAVAKVARKSTTRAKPLA